MSKDVDGFLVDPDSNTFRWFKKLLEEHEQQVVNAVLRDGDQSYTDKLRGRWDQISKLKKALEKAH